MDSSSSPLSSISIARGFLVRPGGGFAGAGIFFFGVALDFFFPAALAAAGALRFAPRPVVRMGTCSSSSSSPSPESESSTTSSSSSSSVSSLPSKSKASSVSFGVFFRVFAVAFAAATALVGRVGAGGRPQALLTGTLIGTTSSADRESSPESSSREITSSPESESAPFAGGLHGFCAAGLGFEAVVEGPRPRGASDFPVVWLGPGARVACVPEGAGSAARPPREGTESPAVPVPPARCAPLPGASNALRGARASAPLVPMSSSIASSFARVVAIALVTASRSAAAAAVVPAGSCVAPAGALFAAAPCCCACARSVGALLAALSATAFRMCSAISSSLSTSPAASWSTSACVSFILRSTSLEIALGSRFTKSSSAFDRSSSLKSCSPFVRFTLTRLSIRRWSCIVAVPANASSAAALAAAASDVSPCSLRLRTADLWNWIMSFGFATFPTNFCPKRCALIVLNPPV
mmetsp:Transcript_254/g.962  ORF Transcript_254/g.962 Transcript_254/m.962 type:complete len:466 (+) Transcript_254:2545-3942(+)